MASEESTARVDDQANQYSGSDGSPREYPATGFHPIDKWSKLLLGLIVVFSLGIFIPVFLNRELSLMGAPWLFYAFPVSILTLTITWLIITYTVVD